MYIIYTLFDYSAPKPRPLYSVICDSVSHKIVFLPIFMRGLGTTYHTAFKHLRHIKNIINNSSVMMNDVTAHLRHMKIDPESDLRICEVFNSRTVNPLPKTETEAKKVLCQWLIDGGFESQEWMRVKGLSSVVYSYLERRGIRHGHKLVYPQYSLGTFSGRSKTVGFNIQGTTDEDPISHISDKCNYMVHFDWVAADIRMAGYLSGDTSIADSFANSDPYTDISNQLTTDDFKINRKECKIEVLKSLYALDFGNPILALFPQLKAWVESKVNDYESSYDYKTILGRCIPKENMKTSFNAIIQGSIAEAMQCVLIQIGLMRPDIILTEVHDSLILVSSRMELKTTVAIGKTLMINPFKGILPSGPRFPVKVSIGQNWKKWKHYKTYRT